eukprot:gene6661-13483_t
MDLISLEKALFTLERAQTLDEEDNYIEAVSCYQTAISQMERIMLMESDPKRKEVFADNIRIHRTKLHELEGILQTMNESAADSLAQEALRMLNDAVTMDETKKDVQSTINAYQDAIEKFLEALKKKNDQSWTRKVSLALDRLGILKQSSTVDIKVSPKKLLVPPTGCVQNTLTEEEINVLRVSSIVNQKPWLEGDERMETFRYDTPWTDPDGPLSLSPSQQSAGAQWCRPREYLALRSREQSGEMSMAAKKTKTTKATSANVLVPVMIHTITPYSVTQEQVSDCSFVASLCIAAAFETKFRRRLVTSIIFPQDSLGQPVYNPSGKYLVKLFFNGVQRKVIVDDLLPVSARGRLLCSCSSNATELWVSIIEKAYLKIHGGYDFPGSNSGVDLYALTGWIPERFSFVEDDEGRESHGHGHGLDHRKSEDRGWTRLLSAHGFGDCLITISTSDDLTEELQLQTGLVSGHAYAVLDVREVNSLRMLLVKNPWARRPWTGAYAANDTARWTPALRTALGTSVEELEDLHGKGVFWMSFEDCRRYFTSFYLNWNPMLFTHRLTLHSLWPKSQGPCDDTFFVGENPQYILHVDGTIPKATTTTTNNTYTNTKPSPAVKTMPMTMTMGASVWILLSKHVTTTESGTGTMTRGLLEANRQQLDTKTATAAVPQTQTETEMETETDFIAVHIQKRVYTRDVAFVKGLYSNNQHNLTRFDLQPNQTQSFVLLLSQLNKQRDVAYSLTVLATTPFRLHKAPSAPSEKVKLMGRWIEYNATVSYNDSSFFRTPQYRIKIPALMRIHIQSQHPHEVGYFLTSPISSGDGTGGVRVDTIHVEDEILTSDMRGEFLLTVAGDKQTPLVSEIPPEGAGMYKIEVCGSWSAALGTAAGCSNYGRFSSNPTYELECNETVDLIVRLRLIQPPTATATVDNDNVSVALNVSLYSLGNQSQSPSQSQAQSQASPRIRMASSLDGVYSARPCGVSLHKRRLEAGKYQLVPSTYMPLDGAFSLTVYSSSPRLTMRS